MALKEAGTFCPVQMFCKTGFSWMLQHRGQFVLYHCLCRVCWVQLFLWQCLYTQRSWTALSGSTGISARLGFDLLAV